jgi:hypothetical protein
VQPIAWFNSSQSLHACQDNYSGPGNAMFCNGNHAIFPNRKTQITLDVVRSSIHQAVIQDDKRYENESISVARSLQEVSRNLMQNLMQGNHHEQLRCQTSDGTNGFKFNKSPMAGNAMGFWSRYGDSSA